MSTLKQIKNYRFFLLVGVVVFSIAIIISFTFNPDENFPEPSNLQRFELIEPKFENSENLKLLPKTNLNKNNTKTQFFGYPVDSTNSIIQAENSEQKFSIRFTAKFSGDISSILLPIKTEEGNKVRVGIHEDNFGFPSYVPLARADAHPYSIIIPSTEVIEVNFTQNVPITKGKIYHILIEPTINQNNQTTWLRAYHDNWRLNSLNHTDPDVTWADPSLDILFYDGKFWLETDNWPIYVIKYSNGLSDGQPYTLFAPWIIGEERYVGQAVIPYSSYTINEISFFVGTKGDPKDDLYYAIYDSKDMVMRDGLFAKKGEFQGPPKWQNVTFWPSLTFESGELYRVVLYSPESTLKDGYHVYGHEFMLDKTLGYGSTIHHLTASFNGLESWIEWYDADAAFKFINSN